MGLTDLGLSHRTLGDFERAREPFVRAATMYERLGDIRRAIQRNLFLAEAMFDQGDVDGAADRAETVLSTARAAGHATLAAGAENLLGVIAQWRGDMSTAVARYEGYVSAYLTDPHPARVGFARWNRGGHLLVRGHADDALDDLEAAMAVFRDLGLLDRIAGCAVHLGRCYRVLNRLGKAEGLIDEGLRLARQLRHRPYELEHRIERCYVRWARRDRHGAETAALQASAVADRLGLAVRAARARVAAAAIAHLEGDDQVAIGRLRGALPVLGAKGACADRLALVETVGWVAAEGDVAMLASSLLVGADAVRGYTQLAPVAPWHRRATAAADSRLGTEPGEMTPLPLDRLVHVAEIALSVPAG